MDDKLEILNFCMNFDIIKMLVESFDSLPKQKGVESVVDFIFRQIKNKV